MNSLSRKNGGIPFCPPNMQWNGVTCVPIRVPRLNNTKFGLPPIDCWENPLSCGGQGFVFEPHLGNENFGQYTTNYQPINNNPNSIREQNTAITPLLTQQVNALTAAVNKPCCDDCKDGGTPCNGNAPTVNKIQNFISQNPLLAIAGVGLVIYLANK